METTKPHYTLFDVKTCLKQHLGLILYLLCFSNFRAVLCMSTTTLRLVRRIGREFAVPGSVRRGTRRRRWASLALASARSTTSQVWKGLSLCFTCPPDCPWIMSGSRLDMMDPSLQHLTRPVRSWQLSEEEQRKKWEGWADMKAPWQRALKALGLPDVFSGEILHGTLFRLPLRSQPSDLSDKPYTPR